MPNFETQPKRLEGHGPPKSDLGLIGDRYTDLDSEESWSKKKTGWTNRGKVIVNPTYRQKGAWMRAAEKRGQNLETWVATTLDAAAKNL